MKHDEMDAAAQALAELMREGGFNRATAKMAGMMLAEDDVTPKKDISLKNCKYIANKANAILRQGK